MTDVDEIDLKLKKYSLDTKDLLKFKKTIEINSVKVDLICIDYSDKLFISVSTNNSFGSVFFAKSDKISNLEERIYNIRQLFGQAETSLEVFTRSLVQKLNQKFSIQKSLLVSIGVKKDQIENLSLLKAIEKNILESFQQ
ncbi:hypothetical protein BpHYR1_036099 [Brachionus plicatilis]|uniref:Uncharacterized protein n=1 Tax=Brachionus plicatilis TaxID=10195 RepID=A0A3M7S5R6_BRAPC|nr:hypothetical protein BpHYR1_036099 [Brachionus plicatilis]